MNAMYSPMHGQVLHLVNIWEKCIE